MVGYYGMESIFNEESKLQEEHMLLQECEFGNLYQLILFTQPFEESPAYVVVNQIALTLAQIHSKNMVHWDIKENNILISRNTLNTKDPVKGLVPYEFILADFGIATDLTSIKEKNRKYKFDIKIKR